MMNKPENDSDSEYSEDSSQITSTSESSSINQSHQQQNVSLQSLMELAKIGEHTLQLPKGLCESSAIFSEFFSMETWHEIPPNLKAYLKNKLPHFPSHCNTDFEQEKTLKMLFNNEIKCFDKSPLEIVQNNLEQGNYRPEVIKLQGTIKKARKQEQQFLEWENIGNLAKSLLISREKLLRKAYNSAPDNINNIDKIVNNVPKLDNSVAALRAKKRYFTEIQKIANELDINDLTDKEDEEIEELKFIKEEDKATNNNNEIKIIGTMVNRNNKLNGTAITCNPSAILNDKHFSEILRHHKKRRIQEADRAEFETNDIRIIDVLNRVEIAGGNNFRNILLAPPKPRKLPAVPVIKPYKYLKMEQKQQSLLRNDLRLPKQLPTNLSLNSAVAKQETNTSLPQDLQLSSSSDEEINIETLKTNSPLPKSSLSAKNSTRIEILEQGNLQKLTRPIVPVTQISCQTPSAKKRAQNPNTKVSVKKQNLNGKENLLQSHPIEELDDLNILQLPVDLEAPIDILNPEPVLQKITPPAVELMQETHACFLSLIRDIFCSTPNHRMKLDELKGKIYYWQLNPITALNDWYSQAENWLILIPSAIYFLSGEFLNQPEEFVPYIEFKAQENIYQWIGAGRDSDNRLVQLCQYWLNRRSDMGMKPDQIKLESHDAIAKKPTENDDSLIELPTSPPPPRFTTTWQVTAAKPEEIEEFRIQERKRFENPHKAFTYRMHGYESVVGPVKGIYTQTLQLTKARGHNTLLADRPNFVTILTLVRDATARLPNGEGTRAEICELLKSSQYISPDAPDNVIHTIVSGALDRMHIEHDPCVRYDPKRKIWIYLHRNRTEEEFERLHQQSQGVSKLPKKSANRKLKQKLKKSSENLLLTRNNPPSTVQQSFSQPPPLVVQTSTLTHTVISKALPVQQQTQPIMPALSSIQSSSKPNRTISPQSQSKPVLLKPELVPIKQTNSPIIIEKEHELLDLNEPPPFILQKPINFQQKLQTATKKSDIKAPLLSPVKTSLAPTNELKLQTALPSPVQSTSLVTTAPENVLPQQILASPTIPIKLSPTNKTVLVQCQPSKQQQIITQARNTIPSSSTATQQSYLIPLNSEQLQVISSIPGNSQSMIPSTSPKSIKIQNQSVVSLPALTSTIGNRPILVQQGKSIIRVAQSPNKLQQPPKISIQQKISPTTTSTIRPQLTQSKQTVSIIGNATIRGPNSQPHQLANAQQKQLIQSMVQQPKVQHRLITANNTQNSLVIGNATGQQTKIVQSSHNQPQQFQKIINVSGQNIITTPVTTNTSTNLINPQIIQIHQPGGTKIQTISANMLQNLKQTVRLPNSQQSLIIKPQSTKVSNNITIGTNTKTVIGANIIASNPAMPKTVIQAQGIKQQKQQQFTIVQTSQQQQQQTQMIPRIIKAANSNTPTSIIQSIQRPQTTSTPVKVLTNTSGQIISLESLLQKQGITQGTTLRVSGGNSTTLKTNQGNLIQLSNNSQLSQFTMVPQNRGIISVSGQQPQQTTRLITSQAVSKSTTTTTNALTNLTATPLTIQNPGGNAIGTTVQLQGASRIIPANQLTPQQLINAKVLTKSPNIRMVNASNLNLANLRTTVGGKQVLISSNKGQGNIIVSAGNTNIQNTTTQSGSQNLHILQTNASGNIVIGGQTLKMQGNVLQQGNIQLINPSSSQSQAVMVGNQIIKVAPSHAQTIRQPQIVTSNVISNSSISNPLTTIASSTNSNAVMVNSNPNQQPPQHRTILLSSATGQTIRLQSPNHHIQPNLSTSTTSQQIIVGTPIKANQLKTTSNVTVSPNQQQRVVLVQGGSQILLPPGFQGGSINFKNIKVVSRSPQQQQPQLQNQINKNKSSQK